MIVGISGAAGAGKDTIGDAFVEHRGFLRMSFASTLKGILSMLFNWRAEDWQDLKWKETPNENSYGLTPRQVAQSFGTDWGRNMINENIWIDATMRMLNTIGTGNWVFTDVRFPNEARAIREVGGILLFVKCLDRETGTEHTEHESERWLEWLELYSDAGLSANLGHIDFLQTAAVNIIDNYVYETIERHTVSEETQKHLDEIEATINKSSGGQS